MSSPTSIAFFASGVPKGQPRAKAFARKFGDKWSARMYDPATNLDWKCDIADAAKPHLAGTPIAGPVELQINYHMPRPKAHYRSNGDLKPTAPNYVTTKPDLDNLDKAVMDCLTRLRFWGDDSQVVLKRTQKVYASKTGAWIHVKPLTPSDRPEPQCLSREADTMNIGRGEE